MIEEKYDKDANAGERNLFMVWFILSMVGMVLGSLIEPLYTLEFFGQYFLVYGIFSYRAGINSDLTKSIGAIFSVCGVVIMLMSTTMILRLNYFKDLYVIDTFVAAAIILFVLVADAIIFLPIIKFNKKKKQCSIKLQAKVEAIREKKDGNETLYGPVYKYFYNGRYYTHDSTHFTHYFVPKVNSYRTIYANPNDLTDVYMNSRILYILLFLVGGLCIFTFLIGTLITILY